MSQSTIFQLCWDRSSWVEPVLSKDKGVLLKDTPQMRLRPVPLRSQVKHSTTELPEKDCCLPIISAGYIHMHFRLLLISEANTMGPDHTAPKGAF